jgi:hypothetical protein
MKAVTEKDKKLWAQVIAILIRTQDFISQLPKKHDMVVECHTICRGLSMHIPELKLVDGHYLGYESVKENSEDRYSLVSQRHSWLVTPDQAIIDPYPVGFCSTNPILVPSKGDYSNFGKTMYFPYPQVTGKISNRSLWRRSRVLLAFMQKAEKHEKLKLVA